MIECDRGIPQIARPVRTDADPSEASGNAAIGRFSAPFGRVPIKSLQDRLSGGSETSGLRPFSSRSVYFRVNAFLGGARRIPAMSSGPPHAGRRPGAGSLRGVLNWLRPLGRSSRHDRVARSIIFTELDCSLVSQRLHRRDQDRWWQSGVRYPIFAVVVVLPPSFPMVSTTVTGFVSRVKSTPLPSTLTEKLLALRGAI